MQVVNVVSTDPRSTRSALRAAGELAGRLRVGVRLLAFQVVPFPLPLDHPPVPVAFTRRRLRALACGDAVRARFEICLCRDPMQALLSLLEPGSLLVISGKTRWWPTAEERLAHTLRANGHRVIFA